MQNTKATSMDFNTFCCIAEAVHHGDRMAAEFAEMSTDAFRALGAAEAAEGGNRRPADPDDSDDEARFYASKKEHPEWAAIFEQACRRKPGLDQSGFSDAVSKIAVGKLTHAQVQALWNGYWAAVSRTVMSLPDFCDIAEAVVNSENDFMAEFANVSVAQFKQLGAG